MGSECKRVNVDAARDANVEGRVWCYSLQHQVRQLSKEAIRIYGISSQMLKAQF